MAIYLFHPFPHKKNLQAPSILMVLRLLVVKEELLEWMHSYFVWSKEHSDAVVQSEVR